MYILFNELGNIVTAIPHGQEVRQGNDFDLYICFPYPNPQEGRQYLNLEPQAKFEIDGSFVSAGTKVDGEWGIPFLFTKADVNEAIYEFKPGHQYVMYHLFVDKESNVTGKYGKLAFNVTKSPEDQSSWQYQGNGIINVIRTIGNSEPTTITPSEYDNLLTNIRAYAGTYTVYWEGNQEFSDIALDDRGYAMLKTTLIKGNLGMFVGQITLHKSEILEEYGDSDYHYFLVARTSTKCQTYHPKPIIGIDGLGNDYEFKIVHDSVDGVDELYLNVDSLFQAEESDPVINIMETVVAETPYNIVVNPGETNIFEGNTSITSIIRDEQNITVTVNKDITVTNAESVSHATNVSVGNFYEGASVENYTADQSNFYNTTISEISSSNAITLSVNDGGTVSEISGSVSSLSSSGTIENISGNVTNLNGYVQNFNGGTLHIDAVETAETVTSASNVENAGYVNSISDSSVSFPGDLTIYGSLNGSSITAEGTTTVYNEYIQVMRLGENDTQITAGQLKTAVASLIGSGHTVKGCVVRRVFEYYSTNQFGTAHYSRSDSICHTLTLEVTIPYSDDTTGVLEATELKLDGNSAATPNSTAILSFPSTLGATVTINRNQSGIFIY